MEEILYSLLFCMDPYGNGIIPYNPHIEPVQDFFINSSWWSTSGGLSFDLPRHVVKAPCGLFILWFPIINLSFSSAIII